MEFVFCMVNERELFGVVEKLICEPAQSSCFEDTHFAVLGF